jgi:L-ribulose-5-phosphate 3-epimerase
MLIMANWKLGVIVGLEAGPEVALDKVAGLGFGACQLSCWHPEHYTLEIAARVRQRAAERGVTITTLWAGTPGRTIWNFTEGPATIGLVPPETRAARLQALIAGADFARAIGIDSITTHVGFIPENPSDPAYRDVVAALREVVGHCVAQGQQFRFETGQETPITLLRTIEDIASGDPSLAGSLGINLDPANLLMYGKANPLDALDVFGSYVRSLHAKDGEYPTNGRELGHEKPLGQGRVDFPALLKKLAALGFEGDLTIEREIEGAQQIADLRAAKAYLTEIMLSL